MRSLFRTAAPSPADVVARVSGLPPARLTEDAPLSEIAPDSFAMVELLLALQEECGLEARVPADRIAELRTLGELLACLQPVSAPARAPAPAP